MPAEGWLPITSCSQFYSFVESSELVVCYISAPWCFNCQQVAEKVAGFPTDYPQLRFYQANQEE